MNSSGSPTGNVLVTGGAGFIGSNLVRLLLSKGFDVDVLDNFSVGRREHLAYLPIRVLCHDIRDEAAVREAVRGRTCVVHLAAETGVPKSLANPRLDAAVNIGGTLNLLEACRQEQHDRGRAIGFVFASSNAPLGRQQPPATEDKAPLPISPYGASKLAGEAYCQAYHGSWGLRTIVLRFANVYGAWSLHKNSVVARFFTDIVEHGEITIDGDGQQTRDFVHVDDLCRAVFLAARSGVGGEVFQIASGRETSISDLARLVCDVTGRDANVLEAPARLGDIRKNYSSIGKVTAHLGWAPEIDLEDGLACTWRWFQRAAHSA